MSKMFVAMAWHKDEIASPDEILEDCFLAIGHSTAEARVEILNQIGENPEKYHILYREVNV